MHNKNKIYFIEFKTADHVIFIISMLSYFQNQDKYLNDPMHNDQTKYISRHTMKALFKPPSLLVF